MIYRSEGHYLCDKTNDQGDSAVRAGMLTLCGLVEPIYDYELSQGTLVRSPIQAPWNNPKNFTRDQLMPIIAALGHLGSREVCRRVFWSRAKHLFFAQNTERDYPGTTKYPWPHKVEGKWRLFDFADPLFPNHVGALILAGRLYAFYWFLPLAYLFHFLFLYLHAKGSHHEENQTIAECSIYKTLKRYAKLKPNWNQVNALYWSKRNETEYATLIEAFVLRNTKS